MARPVLTLLTDFGPEPAAICRGVMLGIAPDAQIVEITNAIRKYAIRDGAVALWCALPYMPVGVHVAVVDPGVGTERLPIAIHTGRDDVLVGPDNGLLPPAAERLGGITAARALRNASLWLTEATSSTFHGRDIFSPVAARLATGTRFEDVGPEVPPDALVRIDFPRARVDHGVLETRVVTIDSFGNAALAGELSDLRAALGDLVPGRPLTVELGEDGDSSVEQATFQRTFGEVPLGAPVVFEDSYGSLALADNQGNVTARLGLDVDHPVRIRGAGR